MGFESRRFKVVFKTLETLGILAEFQGVFLLKFSVSFLAIFLGLDWGFSVENGALFIGKSLWVF